MQCFCLGPAAQGGATTFQRSFQNFPSREPMRRMHTQELKAELSLDRLQMEALHKVSVPGSAPAPALLWGPEPSL